MLKVGDVVYRFIDADSDRLNLPFDKLFTKGIIIEETEDCFITDHIPVGHTQYNLHNKFDKKTNRGVPNSHFIIFTLEDAKDFIWLHTEKRELLYKLNNCVNVQLLKQIFEILKDEEDSLNKKYNL